MVQEVIKTVGIRLKTTVPQEGELKKLFEAFRIGINWSLTEIESRYQTFLKNYTEIPDDMQLIAFCPSCHEEKTLQYKDEKGNFSCSTCARRTYSEYTVRKEVYGVGDREVESDLKDVVEIDVKTHYTMLFSQAYAMWKSYNSWRNKRLREKEMLEYEFSVLKDKRLLEAATQIETLAQNIKKHNPKLTWKLAKAQAVKATYQIFRKETEQKEIERLHDKIMELKRLSRPVHFPQLTECRTVMISNGFVKWENGKLFMTLWDKGQKELDYFGKEYLTPFIKLMEQSNKYCNLTKKGSQYYLMYPLSIPVKQSVDIKECDTFVFMTSPKKTAIIGYDRDGTLNSFQWFDTGRLVFAKRNFKEKRKEISRRRSDDEKMRYIRRRKKKIQKRGAIEMRYVSTFNHQLTRKMVDYVMEQSENPKIIIWDIGNGITQNFGRNLNYLKNTWSAVQQQEYTRHKAEQVGIPVIEIKYNTCNDLTCSSCGAVQANGKKPAKVITQLIKGVKNFKCEKCGYEVNMLINQANNITNVKS